MTAPVITGGSITGVALSGNTLTNPVITGGSINNTTVGATTASTGAFTTLGATGVATFSAGTVSAPAITTTGDTNTGIFFPAADTIAFTEGGVESMRIDSSGNVGIGTSSVSSPSGFTKLVQIFDATGSALIASGGGVTAEFGCSSGGGWLNASGANPMRFAIDQNERMRIDSSGNVGIGTSSPTTKLDVVGEIRTSTQFISNGGSRDLRMNDNFGGTIAAVGVVSSNPLMFFTANTEAMRIDSSGNLLVGTTATGLTNSRSFTYQGVGDGSFYVNHSTANGSGDPYLRFGYNSTQIGSITQSGTTAVLYNVTSDYRLKTVIAPVTNAGERIDALEPIEYDWNAGGRTRGFLAHKFAEVYPNSVSGEKDAVDEKGNPVYQGMQASSTEVMADLIAEIQSLRKRVAQLESK
jgi:hypothetical protein